MVGLARGHFSVAYFTPIMLVNIVNIPTPHGWRSIELREGDITQPDVSAQPDVLVVSSFRGNYYPVPKTVIGCLYEQLGLSVMQLAEAPEFQVGSRDAWMTPPLEAGLPFQRLACVEMLDLRADAVHSEDTIKRAVRSLFGLLAVAEINGVSIKRIAMPILGTGNQGLKMEAVMPWMIETISKLLGNLSGIQTVQLYVLREGAQAAQILNKLLEREQSTSVKVSAESEALASQVCAKLNALLEKSGGNLDRDNAAALELLSLLKRDAGSFITLAALARRLVEAIVQGVASEKGAKAEAELIKKIEGLASYGVAPWMLSYMHTLRVFGNEAVHEKPKERHPRAVNKWDLMVLLLCLDRVLEWGLGAE